MIHIASQGYELLRGGRQENGQVLHLPRPVRPLFICPWPLLAPLNDSTRRGEMCLSIANNNDDNRRVGSDRSATSTFGEEMQPSAAV